MNKRRNEALVGMFVLLGFILLTLLVFFISGVYLFRSGMSVDVIYKYVSILDKGAPVRMAGVRVGEVSSVTLLPSENNEAARVKVRVFIKEGIEVRENYIFKVEGTHVLSEPHIEITPMAGGKPLIQDGTVVFGESPLALENLIEQAHEIAGKVSSILDHISNITGDTKAGDDLKTTMGHLAEVTASLNKILAGSEDDMKSSIANLKNSTDDLKTVLDRLESGEGTAGRLLKDDALYTDMRDLIAEIKAHPWRLLKRDKGSKDVVVSTAKSSAPQPAVSGQTGTGKKKFHIF
ncbi:MAG: MCE family protein [Candidatus Omnitrophica bacterium]|nr:MCE family protein [Candidatus Omnitrophota bacterium]